MSEPTLRDNGVCFVCGPENPIGLHLDFAWEGDLYVTRWTPQAVHQGWADRVHGGLLATVLDELLSRTALSRHGMQWVTAELTTRMKRPVPIGRPLIGRAWIETVRPRLIVSAGELCDAETNTALATGQAKMMSVRV